EYVAQVRADGARRNVECIADRLVGHAFGDHPRDLELAPGQSLRARTGAARGWFRTDLAEHSARPCQLVSGAHACEHLMHAPQLLESTLAVACLGETAGELTAQAGCVGQDGNGLERLG